MRQLGQEAAVRVKVTVHTHLAHAKLLAKLRDSRQVDVNHWQHGYCRTAATYRESRIDKTGCGRGDGSQQPSNHPRVVKQGRGAMSQTDLLQGGGLGRIGE